MESSRMVDDEVGGWSGASQLVQRTLNRYMNFRASWGGDHITRFFILVKLYQNISQITSPDVYGKVARWRPDIEDLVQRMEGVRSKKTKEEANQLAESIFRQMEAIIRQNLRLDPEKNESIREDWKAAKEQSKELEEARNRLQPASSPSSSPTASTLKITVHVHIVKGGPDYIFPKPSPRTLSFPPQFADYSLCPLVFYTLAHPRERAKRNILPITIQAMDTLYLRCLQPPPSSKPAMWGPVDLCCPVTLKEYCNRCNSQVQVQVQVRFVSCRVRFLLLSTYHSGQHCEGIFDLDCSEQQYRLIETLVQGRIDRNTTAGILASAAGAGGSTSHLLPDGTLVKDIVPRTCFVLNGPNKFEKLYPMHPNVNDLSFIV